MFLNWRKSGIRWIACPAWILLVLSSFAIDHYVSPPGGHGTNNYPYTNWADAATNIQWAVNAATNGETVWVTNGNYRLTNEIVVSVSNITLRSVNGRDVTFINGNYAAGNLVTNRCICISNKDVVVNGFTISNGYASGTWGYANSGGGILVMKERASIVNCTIRSNYASYLGGGLCMQGVISNCIIEDNVSLIGGGGVATIDNYDLVTPLTLVNCIIKRNARNGIQANTKVGTGATIRNCIVYNNRASGFAANSGAGIMCANNSVVENCVVVSNWFTYSGTPRGGGVGVVAGATNIYFRNCIVVSNSAEFADASLWDWCTNGSTGTFFYACCTSTTNGMEGGGNITNNPLFVDYGATNFHLQANSPCVNTGTNQNWMTNGIDLDGHRRILYGTVDMGAYELIYEGTMYRLGF